MRFSLAVLLGIWLWSGIFFLPQTEAQIPLREQVKEELRKELREELKKELREEVEKELREEEEVRQKIKAVRQELREQVMTPCRNVFFKKIKPHLRTHPRRLEIEAEAEKLMRELEDITLKELLKKYPQDEDERMAMYFLLRRKCEREFTSQ